MSLGDEGLITCCVIIYSASLDGLLAIINEVIMKGSSIVAIICFIAIFVVSIMLLRSLWVTSDEPSDVIFDNKVFYDTGQTAFDDEVVSISGTLTGEGVGNKNNAVTVTCYQDRMECLTYSIAQIGPNQLGRLEVPSIFPITKWDSNEIVAAESGDTVACRKATIGIERKTETLVWVEDPINQNSSGM
jgi:hypothetical protein